MESFEEYINGLKKEKEEKLEEDIIDEIADRIFKKIQEKLHPPYCPFNCFYYFYYPYCPTCAYHTYTVWTYPPTYSRIPQTYSVDPTDASKTHTNDSWGYGEREDE